MNTLKLFSLYFVILFGIYSPLNAEEGYDYFLEEEKEKSLQILEDLGNELEDKSIFSKGKSSRVVRILPLGDSITFGINKANQYDPHNYRHSYRNHLWYKLRDAGFSVNFVGRRNTGWDVTPSFDGNNEGWPGLNTYEIADKMSSILSAANPDIILLHIGTNDKSTNVSGLNKILNKIDSYESSHNHHIKVVLAKIIGSTDEGHPGRNAIFRGYNNNLASLASSRRANGDDIVVVDMYRGAGIRYDSRDMSDYLHPTNSGYKKMANVWFKALEKILRHSVPRKPTAVKSSSITHSSARIRWTDNANNENGYRIYVNNKHVKTLSSNTTSYNLKNLLSNKNYTIKIVAYNDEGNSDVATVSFKTKPEPIPSKPTNLTVSSIQAYSAKLSWKDNSNNEQGFKIYRGNKYITTVGKNVTKYTLNNLDTRTLYTYKVLAYNKSGKSSTSSASFRTKDDYGWLPAIYHVILN